MTFFGALVFRFFPETKQMSLEEIGVLFGDSDDPNISNILQTSTATAGIPVEPSQPAHAPSSSFEKVEGRSEELEEPRLVNSYTIVPN